MPRDFRPFLYIKKNFAWTAYEQAKNNFVKFFFFEKKNVCPRCCWQRLALGNHFFWSALSLTKRTSMVNLGGFSFTFNQINYILGCVYVSNSNILKIWHRAKSFTSQKSITFHERFSFSGLCSEKASHIWRWSTILPKEK